MELTLECGKKVQSSGNGVKPCLFKALSVEVFTLIDFLISYFRETVIPKHNMTVYFSFLIFNTKVNAQLSLCTS
jgi:hypothetical protein